MTDGLEALDAIARVVLAYRREPKAAVPKTVPALTFYEFFAGGGMARAGLGARWKCLFANDFDFKKSATYEDNWGKARYDPSQRDVAKPAERPSLQSPAGSS